MLSNPLFSYADVAAIAGLTRERIRQIYESMFRGSVGVLMNELSAEFRRAFPPKPYEPAPDEWVIGIKPKPKGWLTKEVVPGPVFGFPLLAGVVRADAAAGYSEPRTFSHAR